VNADDASARVSVGVLVLTPAACGAHAAALAKDTVGGWIDVPVKALAAQEPKACQGDND
jgi:hypothetical protein